MESNRELHSILSRGNCFGGSDSFISDRNGQAQFFSELALCWGGATVSPAAETIVSGRGREEDHWPRNCSHEHAASGGVRKIKPSRSRHWKPMLHAISEDSPISDLTQRTKDDVQDAEALTNFMLVTPLVNSLRKSIGDVLRTILSAGLDSEEDLGSLK
ncbi:Uncharacterized protein Fot_49946 [Forsythia ovata]|uniref:Uncharacterized protein n=1 Tax=Forsythia ovata TaxID=205694 RepID=A0ABD1QDC2_9LAMI